MNRKNREKQKSPAMLLLPSVVALSWPTMLEELMQNPMR